MAPPRTLSTLPIWSAPLVGLVAVLAFFPAMRNAPTHDDAAQVRDYPPPASCTDWLEAAAEPWWPLDRGKNLWRPVPRLSILAQKSIAGDANGYSHYYAFNLFLHALVAMLLLVTARRYGISPLAALLAALIFAAHPLHAEAVHQIVGRAELFAACFMLLGLMLLTRWGPFSPHAFWQQPLCFALALLSKEHAILYPLFVVLAAVAGPIGAVPDNRGFHRWLTTGQWRGLLALLFGLLAVIASYLYVRAGLTGGFLISQATVPVTENPLAPLPFSERLPASLGVLGYATARFFIPLALSPDYSTVSFPVDRGWAWPQAWLGSATIAALIGYLIFSLARRRRGWAPALAGLVAWLLTSNLILIIGVIAARRLWYFPMIPASLAAGLALAMLVPRLPGRMRFLLPGLLVVLLIAASAVDARAWRSPRDYAEATLRRFPDNWRAHTNLAREDYLAREFETGLDHARRAAALFPAELTGWGWVGLNAMFLPGREAEAETAFRRALAIAPEQPETRRNFANFLRMHGRHADADALLSPPLPAPPAPPLIDQPAEALPPK